MTTTGLLVIVAICLERTAVTAAAVAKVAVTGRVGCFDCCNGNDEDDEEGGCFSCCC